MAIAALPDYLRTEDLSLASPALRFGMYLQIWGEDERSRVPSWALNDTIYEVRGRERQERETRKENKRSALDLATPLREADLDLMNALAARMEAMAAPLLKTDSFLRIDARAIAPFSTGLGNEHPLENGFSFLNPYGLPYLPGSGVKGVLRRAASELARGDWGNSHGWDKEFNHRFREPDAYRSLTVIDVLFGPASATDSDEHFRGALSFWDVMPHIHENTLHVEIMTPHQSHYYQGGEAPHESGQPNPIVFLTVPPESSFSFHVVCDDDRLRRLGAGELSGEVWKSMLHAAFTHAFDWLGFGAKTAVGYGAMRLDESAGEAMRQRATALEAQAAQAREAAERAERLAALSPAQRTIDAFVQAAQARVAALRGARPGKVGDADWARAQALAKGALDPSFSDEDRRAAADALEQWMPQIMSIDPKEIRRRLDLRKLGGEG